MVFFNQVTWSGSSVGTVGSFNLSNFSFSLVHFKLQSISLKMTTILISILWLGGKFLSLAARRTILQILCNHTEKSFAIDRTLHTADSYTQGIKGREENANTSSSNNQLNEKVSVSYSGNAESSTVVSMERIENREVQTKDASAMNVPLSAEIRTQELRHKQNDTVAKDKELADIQEKDIIVDETMQAIETAISRQEDIVTELEMILPKVEELLPELEQKAKDLDIKEPLSIPSLLPEAQQNKWCDKSNEGKTSEQPTDKAFSQFNILAAEICHNYLNCILTEKERAKLFQTLSLNYQHGATSIKTLEEILNEELIKCESIYNIINNKRKDEEFKRHRDVYSKASLAKTKNTEKGIQTRNRKRKLNKCILQFRIGNINCEEFGLEKKSRKKFNTQEIFQTMQANTLTNQKFGSTIPSNLCSSYLKTKLMLPKVEKKLHIFCKSCPDFSSKEIFSVESNKNKDCRDYSSESNTAFKPNAFALKLASTAKEKYEIKSNDNKKTNISFHPDTAKLLEVNQVVFNQLEEHIEKQLLIQNEGKVASLKEINNMDPRNEKDAKCKKNVSKVASVNSNKKIQFSKDELQKSIETQADGSPKLIFLKNIKDQKKLDKIKTNIINTRMDQVEEQVENQVLKHNNKKYSIDEMFAFRYINKRQLRNEIFSKRRRTKLLCLININEIKLKDIPNTAASPKGELAKKQYANEVTNKCNNFETIESKQLTCEGTAARSVIKDASKLEKNDENEHLEHDDAKEELANNELLTVKMLLKEYLMNWNKDGHVLNLNASRKNTKNKQNIVSKICAQKKVTKPSFLSRKTIRKCFYLKQGVIHIGSDKSKCRRILTAKAFSYYRFLYYIISYSKH